MEQYLQFGHGGDAVDDAGATFWTRSRGFCLQFGHGGDAVDDEMSAERMGVFGYLQFGHAGDAVDDYASAFASGLAAGLQFGHGGDAVDDNLREHGVEWRCGRSSIRPRR